MISFSTPEPESSPQFLPSCKALCSEKPFGSTRRNVHKFDAHVHNTCASAFKVLSSALAFIRYGHPLTPSVPQTFAPESTMCLCVREPFLFYSVIPGPSKSVAKKTTHRNFLGGCVRVLLVQGENVGYKASLYCSCSSLHVVIKASVNYTTAASFSRRFWGVKVTKNKTNLTGLFLSKSAQILTFKTMC